MPIPVPTLACRIVACGQRDAFLFNVNAFPSSVAQVSNDFSYSLTTLRRARVVSSRHPDPTLASPPHFTFSRIHVQETPMEHVYVLFEMVRAQVRVHSTNR